MSSPLVMRWQHWTWAAISLHFLLILFLGLSRHWGYMSSINDLGVFDQAAWGTMHGQLLLNTSIFNQPINWLGFHFHPVILLFVPLYAIAPSPEWFSLAQALALSVAAWPIFLLASRVCKSEMVGLLWATAYLANPFLLNAAAWDFHPVALAVPFIALGLLAVEKANSKLLLLSCLPLLLIQEQLGLTVAVFGVLWWLHNKRWKTAVGLILLGTTHAALVLGVIMPAFSPTGSHVMLTNDLGQLSRYGWLGKSFSDIAINLLFHPWVIAQKVLFDKWGWFYLSVLLVPFLGFPLAAPIFLLPSLPDLAANLLSATSMPRSVFAYHSVTLVPIFTVAAVYGARRISQWWTWLSCAQVSGLAIIFSLILGYALAPLPTPGSFDFWAPTRFQNVPDPTPTAIIKTLGTAAVSVQGNIGAHFSQRSQIYIFPKKLDEVDDIVLRLESPTSRISNKGFGDMASLASHLQMQPAEYLASIECLLSGKEYGVLLWQSPWLVLKRGTDTSASAPLTRNLITQKLQHLKHEWQVDAGEYREALQRCGKPEAP